MTVWRLVTREIAYRRLNFGLAVLAVLAAVGCVTAQLTLLAAHDERAESLGAAKEEQTRGMVSRLEDDYRKITIQLGYNVLILPKKQNLSEFYIQGHAAETMPEEYAARLAASPLITVQHLMPSLQQKVEWPEKKTAIILMGTRGELPASKRDPKKPLQPAVPPGTIIVGSILGETLGLAAGGEVMLMGRNLKVSKVQPPRGNEDDMTVWMDLGEAQALLGRPGRISAILALSCFCAEASLEGIRREIGRILPDTQTVELSAQAATRRAARARAVEHGAEAIAAEEAGRATMREERAAFAAWVVPLVVVACTVWVGLLALTNVRDRRDEIGILRALGVGGGRVFAIFLSKAALVGLAGAILGYAGGFAIGCAWGGAGGLAAAALFDVRLLAAAVVLAPLLSAAATMVPAMLAAGQDPAVVLREE